MQSKVIEQVTYQLADGVSETCAGFIERCLGKQPGTDHWLDLVFWETLESALAAAAQFNAAPATASFNRCLKKGSVSMSHYEWRSSASGRVG